MTAIQPRPDIQPRACVKCGAWRPANELNDSLCECCGDPIDQPTRLVLVDPETAGTPFPVFAAL